MVIMEISKFRVMNFIFMLHSSCWYLAFCLTPEGLSLLSLKSAVDDDSVLSDWSSSDSTPCLWSGVSCMNITGLPGPRVVGIVFSGKNLRGYIPSELGSLRYLRRLNLSNNEFYGSIPEQLFNATSLHSLSLNGNNLSGSLPSSMCNIPRLQNLDLSSNFIAGSLPKDLRNCKQMQRLILAGNKFIGEIPAGIWSGMNNLIQLDLSDNDFIGSIPQDMSQLKSLSSVLNLSYNHLSGTIPKSLGDLPMTVKFHLRNNNLTGEIPQTGSFENQGPTSFLNNPMLCGVPLPKPCGNSFQSFPESPVSSPVFNFSHRKSSSPGSLVLISIADAAGVALIGLVIVYVYWKRKGSSSNGVNEKSHICSFPCLADDSEMEDEAMAERGKGEGELVAIDKGFTFELDELLRASAYVLGKSGLGIVYKVVLKNGVPVAVRRLGEGGSERFKEFAAEVAAIGKVKHPNILNLRAYYWAPDEKLLISDFISNGSLASALRGKNGQSSTSLPWATRLKIAKGIARGLAYLHECSPRKFIHGDIKPSNILLDNEFRSYISDFGLNRLININGNTPSSGSLIGGAFSYLKSPHREQTTTHLPPEARNPSSKTTQKWDVYSFGVVVLELLTGKSPQLSQSTSTSMEVADIVRWVRKGFEEEHSLSEMVDPLLLQEAYAKKEVLAVFHLALACTETDPEVRPRMKAVSENLERIGK